MEDQVVRNVLFSDLGFMDYETCWKLQEKYFFEKCEIKIRNRNSPADQQQESVDRLFFVEHPHVYTLGKSGDIKNLLADEQTLKNIGAKFYPINRGGDITYHGPGQIVGYPIFDLEHFFTDIHKYLRYLEEAIILTLADYEITAGRIDGLTGVWIDYDDNNRARKIAALGVKCSRWITMHGFAFNVNTDLDYFSQIVPCGIDDKAVTSMSRELGRSLDMAEVRENLKSKLSKVFNLRLNQVTVE